MTDCVFSTRLYFESGNTICLLFIFHELSRIIYNHLTGSSANFYCNVKIQYSFHYYSMGFFNLKKCTMKEGISGFFLLGLAYSEWFSFLLETELYLLFRAGLIDYFEKVISIICLLVNTCVCSFIFYLLFVLKIYEFSFIFIINFDF